MNRDRGVPRRAAPAGLILTGLVFVVIVTSALAGILGSQSWITHASKRRQPTLVKDSLPKPVPPAFVPSNPRPLSERAPGSHWAPVQHSVAARRAPSSSASVVTRLTTKTPEGTANIVSVIGTRWATNGGLWVHVSLPVLPNGTTGWIPRRAVGGYGFVATHLVVDRERFQMILYRGHRAIFQADIGIGKPWSPTPAGTFYIRDKVTDFDNPFYGPVAFGTSARSNTLTDWPGGGFIGIHGTNEPGLLPGEISHGCIRLTNHNIIKLARLMPVGTPVSIR
jgi:lipoprotein-anchoring transpeptidase ErfK/SrfK